MAAIAEKVTTLASDSDQSRRFARCFRQLALCQTAQIAVETTAQTTVGRHRNDNALVDGPFRQQRALRHVDAAVQASEDMIELLRIWPRTFDRILGSPHLGGGHHLHGVGDALDV